MAGGSRRVHTKSRNGCGQCKRRKVKCNEQAPRCSNCCKWKQQCDFELPAELVVRRPRNRPSSNPSSASNIIYSQDSTAPIENISSLNLEHLELMHHYLVATSFTLKLPQDKEQIWDVAVPSQALRHEFLMHAVMSVSALHIVHLQGTSTAKFEYLTRARMHHQNAQRIFRSTVNSITAENREATFMFSCLLLIFSCASAWVSDGISSHDQIDGIILILVSFRTHWRLFMSNQEWLEAKPFGGFLPSDPIKKPQIEVPDTGDRIWTTESLQTLSNFNDVSTTNEEDRKIYTQAIWSIQKALQTTRAIPRSLWPLLVSSEFVQLLEQKRPMALLILAHGCALVNESAPSRWFLNDWTMKLEYAIADVLDPNWLAGLSCTP